MQLTCASKGPASSYRRRLAWSIARGKWLACSLITHMSASWDPLTAEVRVQELAQCLNMGALPSSVPVLLQDELVDRCKAGGVDTAAQHNAAELMPCCAAALHCSCATALELRSCTVESSRCSSAHVRSSASLLENFLQMWLRSQASFIGAGTRLSQGCAAAWSWWSWLLTSM